MPAHRCQTTDGQVSTSGTSGGSCRLRLLDPLDCLLEASTSRIRGNRGICPRGSGRVGNGALLYLLLAVGCRGVFVHVSVCAEIQLRDDMSVSVSGLSGEVVAGPEIYV